MINTLLAAGVDVNPQLNMHRPSRGGNSGRFVEEFYNTGCTPLLRAAIAGDVEVARALLDKGASPNIGGMGLTPFLIAAGVGTGGRGTGLASSTSSGGPVNTALMDLLLEHGADVNAQVTGTKTYSMRISRAPSSTEGMTALHVAAQRGNLDEVRYLLEKGAKTDLLDSNGHKPIDLAGAGAAQPGPAPAVGARVASAAETRAVLQNAAAQR
jgi:ankyrin repeat protein